MTTTSGDLAMGEYHFYLLVYIAAPVAVAFIVIRALAFGKTRSLH